MITNLCDFINGSSSFLYKEQKYMIYINTRESLVSFYFPFFESS